jgi:ribosomal protein S18 acetylase RimI-like enzyme
MTARTRVPSALRRRRAEVAKIATGSLLELGDTTRIGRVLVAPTRRGQGWGRRLVTALIERAAEREDMPTITMGVYEHNQAARRLYQDLGFMETETRGQVSLDDETWTSLELVLPVRPAA